MSESSPPVSHVRLASLARAMVEAKRFKHGDRARLDAAWNDAVNTVKGPARDAARGEFDRLLPAAAEGAAGPPARKLGGAGADAATVGAAPGAGDSVTKQLMQQRASLELQLKTEREHRAVAEKKYAKEQEEHRHATEALSLQQRKLKELQTERTTLLAKVGELDDKLRAQLNLTEQSDLKFDKLKSSRESITEQATAAQKQINELKAENLRLREEFEDALRARDRGIESAQAEVDEAMSGTAGAAFGRLWKAMQADADDVFIPTHVPNEGTFQRLCETHVAMLRVMSILERGTHQMLRDLRQVSDKEDKLSHYFILLTKNPGVAATLRDYLVTGKRKSVFVNVLRAVESWVRAFNSGMYKVIVRAPATIGDELNPRRWPIKSGFAQSEDAAIGEYFRESVQKAAPEHLGTTFRKQAAEFAYVDFDQIMKQH